MIVGSLHVAVVSILHSIKRFDSMSIRSHVLERLGSVLPITSLHVPEWDATVFVKSLTLGERLILKQLAKDEKAVIIKALRLGIVDEDGAPIFSAEDESALLAGDGPILERLACAVLGHNRDRDPEALEKN